MSPERQREAIAKACGWTEIDYTHSQSMGWRAWGTHPNPIAAKEKLNPMELPDYISDLNAMNEAEKGLTDEQRLIFIKRLRDVCEDRRYRHVISATAAQRAEALLKTLNLTE